MKEYDDKNSRFEHDFEEQCTLGSGYFGIVKKCRNKVDGSIYAIKIMKPFQKNLNEVKALATLSNVECGNIVRYHNSWIEDGRLFMVMEYCETSLKKVIEEHR
jgi:serine/threonine protein kinase